MRTIRHPFLLLLLLCAVPLAAQTRGGAPVRLTGGTVTMSVPDTSAIQGQTFDLPVRLSDVTGRGVIAAQWRLTFDPAALQPVQVLTAGTLTQSWSAPAVNAGAGSVHVAMAGTDTLTGGGVLAYVRFTVQPSASGTSPLSLSDALLNEDIVPEIFDGSFTALPSNVPPLFTRVMGDTVLAENQPLLFDYDASDANGDTLRYRLLGPPAGMSIDTLTGLMQWTPSFNQAGLHEFTIEVSDGKGASVSRLTSITVFNTNRAPQFTKAFADTVIAENQPLQFFFTAVDPDGETVRYKTANAPAGLSIDTMTGRIDWTPSFVQSGSYSFIVTATDPQGMGSGTAVSVTVTNVNRSPVPGKRFTDTTIAEDQPLQFVFSASDPDGDVLRYSLVNAPAGMSVDSVTGTLAWRPTFFQAGVHPFAVQAKDGFGASASMPASVTVTNVNRAPSFLGVPPDTVRIVTGAIRTFQYTGSDPDNDAVGFTGVELPTGASLSAQGAFSWTPQQQQVGEFRVIVRLSDGGLSVSDTSYILVSPDNQRPVFTRTLNDTTVQEQQALSFTYGASDPDGDSLTFFLAMQPVLPGLSITKSGALSWTPSFDQSGVYTIVVGVQDEHFPAYDTAVVTVANLNRAPAFAAVLPDITVPVDTPAVFLYAAIDADNDPLTFSLVKGPAGAAVQSDGRFQWKPVAAQMGLDTVIVGVSDGSVTVPDTAFVTVVGFPTVHAGPLDFDLGTVTFGGSKRAAVTVRNDGIVPLLFRALTTLNPATDPNFRLDTAGRSIVLPGQHIEIGIEYQPLTVGGHGTGFAFSTNDPKNPVVVVTVRGTAIATLVVKKRVLVDTLHAPAISMTDTVDGLGRLFSFLRQSGIQTSFASHPLGASGHDILLTMVPTTPYSDTEADSVRDFVRAGGLLIAVGNSSLEGTNQALNTLLTDTSWTTGLALNDDVIIDSSAAVDDPRLPKLFTFADSLHPYLTGVDTLLFFGSASVRTSGTAVPLVTATAKGQTLPPSAGTPTAVGISTVGKGRVVALGDLDAWRIDERNGVPNIGRFDNLAFALNLLSITEAYEVKLPGKTPNEQYRLVSIPYDLENADIAAVLKDLGGVNPLVWRLFGRFDPKSGAYAEFPSERFRTFRRGEAYWLITRGEFDLSFGNATLVPVQEYFPIRIGPGYSMIGNPFPYTVSWKNSLHDSVQQILWRYDGSTFRPESLALEPFTGYFVKNLTNDSLTIYINPQDIGGQTLPKGASEGIAAGEWRIAVRARSGRAADEENVAGVSASAKDGYDRLDAAEPPTSPTDYLMLRFINTGWSERPGSYAVDLRAPNEEGTAWDFDVTAYRAHSSVRLTFDRFGELPADFEVYLVDRRTERAVRVTGGSAYEFTMARGETRRAFRLVAGRNGFVENNTGGVPLVPVEYALEQNHPNPFNPATTIRYAVGRSGRVSLNIVNVLGQTVRTLSEGHRPIGVYSAEWDGRTDRGTAAASGVYFYTLRVEGESETLFTATRKMVLLK